MGALLLAAEAPLLLLLLLLVLLEGVVPREEEKARLLLPLLPLGAVPHMRTRCLRPEASCHRLETRSDHCSSFACTSMAPPLPLLQLPPSLACMQGAVPACVCRLCSTRGISLLANRSA